MTVLLVVNLILLVIVPVLILKANALGVDLVYFGIVCVVNMMLGLITPPKGLLLFVMTSIPGCPLREILPFLFVLLAGLLVITLYPISASGCRASSATKDNRLMSRPIHVLNGPNLNRLGLREPQIYGHTTLMEIEALCIDAAGDRPLVFRQTNSERQMIDWIHEAIDDSCALLINPAAFTFYSMAIMDALKMYPFPMIEYHISNIHKREPMYHKSLVSGVATVVMAGAGASGYVHAVRLLGELVAESERAP